MSTRQSAPVQWCLVLPLKRLSNAKTRLGQPYAGIRRELALAFAIDTAAAACRTADVVRLIVVADEAAAVDALERLGALVVLGEHSAGLNAAISHGAQHAARSHPEAGVGALVGDLPALRPQELAQALAEAQRQRCSFVRDDTGTGTTLLLARPGLQLAPSFGPGSAERHLDSGYVELTSERMPGLRCDVDDAPGLRRALALGVGARTRRCLQEKPSCDVG